MCVCLFICLFFFQISGYLLWSGWNTAYYTMNYNYLNVLFLNLYLCVRTIWKNCVYYMYHMKIIFFSIILYNISSQISKKIFTKNLHFTEAIVSIRRITIRERLMSSVVVVDDVSAVVRAGDVDRIRYCCSGVVFVLKT